MNTAFTGLTAAHESNIAFSSGPFFWDLRAETLTEQATGPIKNPVEMLGYNFDADNIMAEIISRLNQNNEYSYLFELAFGDDNPITEENIAKALATFQRKIISPNSRFDQFLLGDTQVFNEKEIIGLNKFIDGGCADCHNGPLLSNNTIDFDKIVIDKFAPVRPPSLRNITQTATYMQDGSRRSLGSAIGLYEDRGDLGVSAGEGDFDDIEVFLRTLDSPVYSDIPTYVPSGLPVGGDIH